MCPERASEDDWLAPSAVFGLWSRAMCLGGTSEGGCPAPLCPEHYFPSIKTLNFMDSASEITFPSIKTLIFMDGKHKIVFPSIKTHIFMDGTRKITFPSIKTLIFMDGARKISFPSIKQAVFMDGGTDGVASVYVCVCVRSRAVEVNALCYSKML